MDRLPGVLLLRVNRSFGYCANGHPLPPRQLIGAQRSDIIPQVALARIESALIEAQFKRRHLAVVCMAERALSGVWCAIEPGAVGLRSMGWIEDGYMPLATQPDVYASMMRLEQRETETQRLAAEGATGRGSVLERLRKGFAQLGAGSRQAPYTRAPAVLAAARAEAARRRCSGETALKAGMSSGRQQAVAHPETQKREAECTPVKYTNAPAP